MQRSIIFNGQVVKQAYKNTCFNRLELKITIMKYLFGFLLMLLFKVMVWLRLIVGFSKIF